MPAASSASAAGTRSPRRHPHGALAHRREGAVRQRGEVTGAAQRPVLVDDRDDPGGQHRRVGARGRQPHPGPPGRQRGQPQQHHRPHHLGLHLRAGPGGVRADQRLLQLRPQFPRDVPGGQRPEPGGHAVVRGRVPGERVDHRPAGGDRRLGLRRQGHHRALPGDRDDLCRADRPRADGDRALSDPAL